MPNFTPSTLCRFWRSKCMWKSPISSLDSSHSSAEGFTPRSTSAPTVMSPLIPEKQSRKRTFMVWEVVGGRRSAGGGKSDEIGHLHGAVVERLADDAAIE